MRFTRAHRSTRRPWRPVISAIAGLAVLGSILTGQALADPADDALAKLNELSRQAEQTTEAMHSAQLDLNNKLAAQQLSKLKVYAGPEHPHSAQQPKPYEFTQVAQ